MSADEIAALARAPGGQEFIADVIAEVRASGGGLGKGWQAARPEMSSTASGDGGEGGSSSSRIVITANDVQRMMRSRTQSGVLVHGMGRFQVRSFSIIIIIIIFFFYFFFFFLFFFFYLFLYFFFFFLFSFSFFFYFFFFFFLFFFFFFVFYLLHTSTLFL